MRAQLPRVEQAMELDAAEHALAQLAELFGAVLADVPRIAGARLALGRQRQHVRRRHVRHTARPQQRAEVLERRLRVLQMLDRLQEDDGVALLRIRLYEVALERKVAAAVAQARVLVR